MIKSYANLFFALKTRQRREALVPDKRGNTLLGVARFDVCRFLRQRVCAHWAIGVLLLARSNYFVVFLESALPSKVIAVRVGVRVKLSRPRNVFA